MDNMIALKNRVLNKLEGEFHAYQERLLTRDSKTIFDRSYETIVKQNLIDSVEEAKIPEKKLHYLLEMQNSLDYLYQQWIEDPAPGIYSDLVEFWENGSY